MLLPSVLWIKIIQAELRLRVQAEITPLFEQRCSVHFEDAGQDRRFAAKVLEQMFEHRGFQSAVKVFVSGAGVDFRGDPLLQRAVEFGIGCGGRLRCELVTNASPAIPMINASGTRSGKRRPRTTASYSVVHSGEVETSSVETAIVVYSSEAIQVAKCTASAMPAAHRIVRCVRDIEALRSRCTAPIAKSTAEAIDRRSAEITSGAAPVRAYRAKIAAAPTASWAPPRIR